MKKRPWMPLYTGDFLLETAHLNATQKGVYISLLIYYWEHESLPNDDKLLARIGGVDIRQWRKIWPVLSKLFSDSVVGLRHTQLDHEMGKMMRISAERQKSAGQKNSSLTTPDLAPKMLHGVDDFSNDINAGHEQLQTHSHTHSHSHSLSPKKREESTSARASEVVVDLIGEKQEKPNQYLFEEGVIRLTSADYQKWKTRFSNINLDAELTGLAQWAGKQENWFFALSGALAKRDREALLAIKSEAKKPNGLDNPWIRPATPFD